MNIFFMGTNKNERTRALHTPSNFVHLYNMFIWLFDYLCTEN